MCPGGQGQKRALEVGPKTPEGKSEGVQNLYLRTYHYNAIVSASLQPQESWREANTVKRRADHLTAAKPPYTGSGFGFLFLRLLDFNLGAIRVVSFDGIANEVFVGLDKFTIDVQTMALTCCRTQHVADGHA